MLLVDPTPFEAEQLVQVDVFGRILLERIAGEGKQLLIRNPGFETKCATRDECAAGSIMLLSE